MSHTSPEDQFDLEPHEYGKIVAPLRPEKASTPATRAVAALWVLMVLLFWPVGERVAESVGEAVYSRVLQLREALQPS